MIISSSYCYDLHSHSTASDGVLTPQQLVIRAHEKGVNVLALTDHDTIDGLVEASMSATQLGIELINGVEISTVWQNKVIHIVGLGFDANSEAMQTLLKKQAQIREMRALKIAEKLTKCGIPDPYVGAKALTDGEITRAHYARYLVQLGKVKNETQAFKRYLGQNKPAYVAADWVDLQMANDVIHQAGGLAVCAHPLRYPLTRKWLMRLLTEFKEMGGDAVEVAHNGQSPQQRQELAKIVTDLDMYASVGSDFHFPHSWVELGKNLTLPEISQPIWTAPLFTSKGKK